MNQRSRTEYSLINIFASFAGYGLNILLSFMCRMIFVRFLAEEYLGINGLFSNIISMLSLTELGIGTAIVYALYKPIATNDQKKIASLMKFFGTAYKIIGMIIGVLGICLMPFLDVIVREKPNIPENLYVIYCLFLFSTASSYFFSYRSTIMTAYQRNYIVVSLSYFMVIVQNIIQIIVLVLYRNFIAYLLIQVICVYITNFLISWKAKKDYPFIDEKDAIPLSKTEKVELIKNVKALTVTKLAGILVNNTDNIVITYFNGLVTTGAASNYTLLTSMLSSLIGQVFSSLTASVGNLNATESGNRKFEFFSALNLANFWTFGWASVGIIVISSDIVQLCFGKSYVLDWIIPVTLAINFFILGMQNAVLTYRSTLGLFKYGQYLLLVTAALNIVGDIVLGKRFGLAGIFAATIVARLLTNAWYDPYAVFKYGLHKNPLIYFMNYIKYVLVLLMTVAVCVGICTHISLLLPLQILAKVIICSVVSNMIFLLVFGRTRECKYLFEKGKGIIKKVKKRK